MWDLKIYINARFVRNGSLNHGDSKIDIASQERAKLEITLRTRHLRVVSCTPLSQISKLDPLTVLSFRGPPFSRRGRLNLRRHRVRDFL